MVSSLDKVEGSLWICILWNFDVIYMVHLQNKLMFTD